MRDLSYKIRSVRLSDDLWKRLKNLRKKSGLSWNQFIKDLITRFYERP